MSQMAVTSNGSLPNINLLIDLWFYMHNRDSVVGIICVYMMHRLLFFVTKHFTCTLFQ